MRTANDYAKILDQHLMHLNGEPGGKCADLRGANLALAVLPENFWYEADLRGANLSGANLYGVNLQRANLSGAALVNTSLVNARLDGANLCNANMRDADLYCSSLVLASMDGASLCHANMKECNAECSSLIEADLMGAKLRDSRLCSATLTGAHIIGADFTGADLRCAKGIAFAECSFSAVPSMRGLLGVVIDGDPVFFYGLFIGNEDELRDYIDGRPEGERDALLSALVFVVGRLKEATP